MEVLKQVFLLALVVSLTIQGGYAVVASCSRENVPEELHIDVFTELLSNHTVLASTLRAAPFIGNMDPNAPAYEFKGSGLHLSDRYLSDAIRAQSCSSNEITLISSVFFKDGQSAGPILELSYADSFGQTLPVFSLRMDALADEIIIAYRHLGNLHTEVFGARLHSGRWRMYGVTLSGNQAMVYDNCELIHQRVIPLPDYCTNDSALVLSVADSALQEDELNRISVYLQNVGIHFGQRGIQQVCPAVPESCPSCGQFLRLVEKVYLLNQEVEQLRQRVADLETNGVSSDCKPVSAGKECSHTVGEETVTFAHGRFMKFMNQTVCYCLDGNVQCTPSSELCDEEETTPPPTTPEDITTDMDPGITTGGIFTGCDGEGTIPPLRLGGIYTMKVSSSIDCRVFICEAGDFGPARVELSYECLSNYSTCASNFTDLQKSVAQCCRSCDACRFVKCPGSNTKCSVNDQGQAECECVSGYRLSGSNEGCVDIDECLDNSNRCPKLSKCTNTPGSFVCECEPGYTMASSSQEMTCEDENECDSPNTNNCSDSNMTCINTLGSYQCDCPEGSFLTPSGVCETDVMCDPPCQNGGQCIEGKSCRCHPGYKGDRCEEDVNECKEGNHTCNGDNAVCINTQGGFFCRCKSGYMGNGQICEDIDECSLNLDNCLSDATCVNVAGSFHCLCSNNRCTGACRYSYKRNTFDLPNFGSMIVANCRNCTCVDGKVSCVKLKCNCDTNPPRDCCPQCYRQNCVYESVKIRPGQTWVNPQDRCERVFCEQRGSILIPVSTDLSQNCPKLDCPANLTIQPMGKCCPICLLPPCTESSNKQSVRLRNGCETCNCLNSQWNCQQSVACPSIDCDPEQILFSENGCCPVCASQALNTGLCGV